MRPAQEICTPAGEHVSLKLGICNHHGGFQLIIHEHRDPGYIHGSFDLAETKKTTSASMQKLSVPVASVPRFGLARVAVPTTIFPTSGSDVRLRTLMECNNLCVGARPCLGLYASLVHQHSPIKDSKPLANVKTPNRRANRH